MSSGCGGRHLTGQPLQRGGAPGGKFGSDERRESVHHSSAGLERPINRTEQGNGSTRPRLTHTDVTAPMKRATLLSLLGTGLAIAASAFAPAAQAHGTGSLAGCASPALSPALSAFGDPRSYFVAPGGDFESSRHGWQLTGGAALAAGSGPLRRGTVRSLRLPAGATATSPVFCVDLDYPTFRFFHARGASPLSVDVIYPASAPGIRRR